MSYYQPVSSQIKRIQDNLSDDVKGFFTPKERKKFVKSLVTAKEQSAANLANPPVKKKKGEKKSVPRWRTSIKAARKKIKKNTNLTPSQKRRLSKRISYFVRAMRPPKKQYIPGKTDYVKEYYKVGRFQKKGFPRYSCRHGRSLKTKKCYGGRFSLVRAKNKARKAEAAATIFG